MTTTLEKTPTPESNVMGYLDMATKWEASRIESLERSERRAWITAGTAGVLLALAVGAIAAMAPLKVTEPYVVRVDENGVPTIVTAMRDQIVTGDSVMDKYWLAKYVTHRHSYDLHTIEHDYNTVGMLSDGAIGAEYAAQYQGDNAMHERLGDRVKTVVDVLSVVLSTDAIASVRFRTTTTRIGTGKVEDSAQWIATVSFEYQNTEPMTEVFRLVNPFGFRVTSYRLDPEYIGGSL